jgi:DnaJ-class molecular chaperone
MEKDTNDTFIKCPNCDGRGFYSVDYHLAEEEMHCVCEDCIGNEKSLNINIVS